MLIELVVQNFALLDQVEVEFSPGLNVLTGETGAGKSLLMGALSLVLGGRASAEVVRQGAECATIQARFQLAQVPPELETDLAALDLEPTDELILFREINANGRSKCRIGTNLVGVGDLAKVGRSLVDIHGQHSHQSLLDPKTHLAWLDEFAGDETLALAQDFKTRYHRFQAGSRKLKELEDSMRTRARELDLLRYELAEIQEAALELGEELELEEELKLLSGAQELEEVLEQGHLALSEDGGVLAILGELSQSLGQRAVTKEYEDLAAQAENLLLQTQEFSSGLRTLAENLVYDPQRLAFVEERLAQIRRLERKYGKGTEAILDHAQEVAARVDELEGADEDCEELRSQLGSWEAELEELAAKLREYRAKAARELAASVSGQLTALKMAEALFQVELREQSWDATGSDDVEFMIAPNPGEGLGPLAKIASGGEISRIMLALKCVLAEVDKIGTLIFDEIDTGIGGRTLQAVAERLALLAERRQVICVTHAPQIASLAASHFAISKVQSGERTKTEIQKLTVESRVEELARMLGGAEVTGTTMGHAKEMLRLAAEKKAGIKESLEG